MLEHFLELMRGSRFPLSTEEAAKAEMEKIIRAAGIPFARERALDKKNRPDFMIEGFAIEVKIGGAKRGRQSAMSIFKQCERYSKFQEVVGVVLITNRAMGAPKEINGKPFYYVSLGAGWL